MVCRWLKQNSCLAKFSRSIFTQCLENMQIKTICKVGNVLNLQFSVHNLNWPLVSLKVDCFIKLLSSCCSSLRKICVVKILETISTNCYGCYFALVTYQFSISVLKETFLIVQLNVFLFFRNEFDDWDCHS